MDLLAQLADPSLDEDLLDTLDKLILFCCEKNPKTFFANHGITILFQVFSRSRDFDVKRKIFTVFEILSGKKSNVDLSTIGENECASATCTVLCVNPIMSKKSNFNVFLEFIEGVRKMILSISPECTNCESFFLLSVSCCICILKNTIKILTNSPSDEVKKPFLILVSLMWLIKVGVMNMALKRSIRLRDTFGVFIICLEVKRKQPQSAATLFADVFLLEIYGGKVFPFNKTWVKKQNRWSNGGHKRVPRGRSPRIANMNNVEGNDVTMLIGVNKAL